MCIVHTSDGTNQFKKNQEFFISSQGALYLLYTYTVQWKLSSNRTENLNVENSGYTVLGN